MKLYLTEQASKQFCKLKKNDQIKISRRIEIISTNPYTGKRLKGKLQGLFSLRAWPYRIIYQISKKTKAIYLVCIEHRQGVYR